MRYLLELIAISRENFRFGHEAQICPIPVNHRKVPRPRGFEFVHHAVHLFIDIDISWSGFHKIIDVKGIILLNLEHIAADILQGNKALEMPFGINYREYIPMGFGNHIYKLSQGCIYFYGIEVILYQVIGFQESKHGLITIVGKEFPPLGNTLGIDGIWLNHSGESEGNR